MPSTSDVRRADAKSKKKRVNAKAVKRKGVGDAKTRRAKVLNEDGEEVDDEDEDGRMEDVEEEEEEDEKEKRGVNTIKALLRQTKRLLGKEKLSALSRQDGERRLIALEDELRRRQEAQSERENAQRSHKIRFFERQKLTRKIGKLKRQADDKSDDVSSSVQEDLREHRILLNYVLHYPLVQPYVSLFPKVGPSPLSKDGNADKDDGNQAQRKEIRKRYAEVRKQIIKAMDAGELSAVPEEELQRRMEEDRTKTSDGPSSGSTMKRKQLSVPSSSKKKKKSNQSKETDKKDTLQDDDFFA